MTTETGMVLDPPNFPVDYDTVVTVSCDTGKKLVGSEYITCVDGTEYTLPNDQPECEKISMCTSEIYIILFIFC